MPNRIEALLAEFPAFLRDLAGLRERQHQRATQSNVTDFAVYSVAINPRLRSARSNPQVETIAVTWTCTYPGFSKDRVQ
jgi:hypothetical protein